MQLLGAREFIKMPAGTFYLQYWMNTVEECLEIDENSIVDVKIKYIFYLVLKGDNESIN